MVVGIEKKLNSLLTVLHDRLRQIKKRKESERKAADFYQIV